jgi:hypothetical protein
MKPLIEPISTPVSDPAEHDQLYDIADDHLDGSQQILDAGWPN